MTAYLITVGDEILIGQIIDTNSAYLATQLNLIGTKVIRKISVPDDAAAIKDALREGLAMADIVLMTGGLGPTKDDITKKAIADFLGQNMRFDQPTYDRILKLFERWGRKPTEAHRLQCYMPEGAELLHNKMGTAPGMWFNYPGNKVLVSMPGVPYEMEYLMEKWVLAKLRDHFPGQPIAHRTILTIGEGESRIADRLSGFEAGLPAHIKLAYLPNLGQVRLRLSGTHPDQAALDAQLDDLVRSMQTLLPELIFGYEKDDIQSAIGRMLQARNLTLATAESCTGGYLAHLITSVPGSSAYFRGSVIAYHNEVKTRLLGVRPATLEQHGAVSEPTVREMVAGALEMLGADLAVATSGIAGPDGGTPDKPVGTVWMAVGNRARTQTFLLKAGKDRLKNIQFSSVHALNLIRRFLEKEDLSSGINA